MGSDLQVFFNARMWKGGRPETVSGKGSTLAFTTPLRPVLEQLLRKLNVRSLLDAGCGDFNWMREVNLDGIAYTGLDVIEDVIESNRRKYSSTGREFRVADVSTDSLPAVDLMLCRHCAFHLPIAIVWRILENFERSGTRKLLLSNQLGARNLDLGVPGGYEPRDFLAEPFLLPKPKQEYWLPDGPDGRYLCLWTSEEVAAALKRARSTGRTAQPFCNATGEGARYSHFLHIRKTGGTAIRVALAPVAQQFRIVLHDHAYRLANIPVNDRVFFFVRDPVARFVSGFNDRLREGRPRWDVPWNAPERRAFERFKTPTELAEALSASDEELRDRAEFSMRKIGHVRQSLKNWFASKEEIDVRLPSIVWIGFQESLSEDFEELKRRLGLPSTVALPLDGKASHRAPEGFETELSPLGRRNIESWFATDMEMVRFLKSARDRIAMRQL